MSTIHVLPPLPYADNALDPVISANTIGFHYGKHHKAYVDNLNKLVAGTELADMPLEEIIAGDRRQGREAGDLQQRRAGLEPHLLLEQPEAEGRRRAAGALKQKIDAAFGSYDAFKKELRDAAVTQFGSGWAWLVADGGDAEGRQDRQRRDPLTKGHEAAADHRRLGARLLPRLPEPPRRLRQRLPRQAGQLGVRRRQPRVTAAAS